MAGTHYKPRKKLHIMHTLPSSKKVLLVDAVREGEGRPRRLALEELRDGILKAQDGSRWKKYGDELVAIAY